MFKFSLKPKIMVFFTSYRCNLRCAMCYAWIKQQQVKELSLEEITSIFNDRAIRDNLEIINITGGEPTLRKDLALIVKAILQQCTRLKRIDISTNGVNTEQVIDQIERILALSLPAGVKVTANISLDGIGPLHERVRGAPGIFGKIEQTIEELKELMNLYPFFSIGFNMTISKLNCGAIEEVRNYAMQRGIGISFTLAAISGIGVDSKQVRDKFELGQEEKDKIALSFSNLLRKGAIAPYYGRFVISWLRTGRRKGDCAFRRRKALLVEPDGNAYLCGNFEEFGIGNLLRAGHKPPLNFNINNFSGKYKIKCETCNSNCYMGI